MRETETRGALRPPQWRRRAENSTPRTRSEKKKLNLSPNPITFISHTGLVGVLPKLLEKDLHRIITGWANEFGPVFKLRVMQFHVSRESFCSFFLFLVFSSLSFPSRAEPRRVSPLSLSLARALSTNLSPKKKKKNDRPSSSPTRPWPRTSAAPSCSTSSASSTTLWTR